VLVALAALVHMVLASAKLIQKRGLRMPLTDYVQVGLGLVIPVLLSTHVIYTMGAHRALDVDTRIGYLVSLIWGHRDGWLQAALVLIVWVHSGIGLHMWLRNTAWWTRNIALVSGIGVLIPTLALLGFVTAGRTMRGLLENDRIQALAYSTWNMPDAAGFGQLAAIDTQVERVIWALLAALLGAVLIRQTLAALRRPIRVTYIDGPVVRAPRGQTVLETSRSAGLAHTALCGGRGRCTTCRVIIEDGEENAPPPEAAEQRTLQAVAAPPGTRLACQLRPTGPVSVFRVFGEDGSPKRAHASQGREARIAILFLDMRGFTARTDGQLPYDVVFLLNRFFDQIVPPILSAGGTVDKYLGDGLMALFEDDSPARSARAALDALQGIGAALEAFNATLAREGSAPVAIGIGIHLGNVVLGEIGAAGQAPRTLIGDAVNTASRLEAETKAQKVEALVSESVLRAAGLPLSQTEMTALRLRGREKPLDALPVPRAAALRDRLAQLGQVLPAE